jgi:hypothetical protein
MNLENSNSKNTDLPMGISESETKKLFSDNQTSIISILNECYLAFGLLDIIDNSNTSKIMKVKIEGVLKKLGTMEQQI